MPGDASACSYHELLASTPPGAKSAARAPSPRRSQVNIQLNQEIVAAQSAEQAGLIFDRARSTMDADNIATVLHCIAKRCKKSSAATSEPRIQAIVQSASESNLQLLSARAISHPAWALAVMRINHAPLLESIAASAIAKSTELPPFGIAHLAWACSRLGFVHNPLLYALS